MPRHACLILPLAVAECLFSSCSAGTATPASPSPLPQPNSTINYTAIAASDGIGYNSSVPCLPFAGLPDCPNGKGYVYEAARQLQTRNFTVKLTNLSIPGAVIGPDFQDSDHPLNFIERETPFTPANSTLITIFTGANDVNVVTSAMGKGAGASDQVGYIDAQVKAFGADYAALLSALRGRAAAARFVVLNLPNMGALPFLAGASSLQRQAAQRLSVGMTTTVINPLTGQGVAVIDMMCDPRSYLASTYSSDGFHPSDAGYAWMAAEVVSAATVNYKSPQTTCSQMTLIPQ